MASDTHGGVLSSRHPRLLQVELRLQHGEKSFGMSLAQKQPAMGPKCTVVTAVFSNSPAARAGVRRGYVVLRINDEDMSGRAVAEVASHFRNVPQTRITLEVHESEPLRSMSATAGFAGGLSTPGTGQRSADMTDFAGVSGRAIAAPGSALGAAPPKLEDSKHNPKAAAKSIAPPRTVPTQNSVVAKTSPMLGADAKMTNGRVDPRFRSIVTPVLRLGTKPKPVENVLPASGGTREEPIEVEPTTTSEPKPNRKSLPISNRNASKVPRSPVQAIEEPRNSASAPVAKVQTKPATVTVKPPQPSLSAAVPAPVTSAQPNSTPKAVISKPAVPTSTEAIAASAPASAKASKEAQISRKHAATPVASSSKENAKPGEKESAAAPRASAQAQSTSIPASDNNPKSVAVKPPSKSSAHVAVQNSILVSAPVTTRVAMSAPAPPVTPTSATISPPSEPVAAPAATASAKPKTGRKRGRPRKHPAGTKSAASAKSKAKAQQPQLEERNLDAMDDEIDDVYQFLSSEDEEAEAPPKRSSKRKGSNKRGSTERHRHSLTIDRLIRMGFEEKDAEESVKHNGDNADACMLWIISVIEERQFNADLNTASIQSEESKRDEEKRVKKQKRDSIAHAEGFVTLFPTSYILSPESPASRLKKTLDSTMDQVKETYLREIVGKVLTLESQAIRWYQKAPKPYMMELATRLEAALGAHDMVTCCSQVSTNNASSCTFVQTLVKEEKALKKALFDMPENQGGVPMEFLQCDDAMQFSLDDDGFEVMD